jgi:hypothetical protein
MVVTNQSPMFGHYSAVQRTRLLHEQHRQWCGTEVAITLITSVADPVVL